MSRALRWSLGGGRFLMSEVQDKEATDTDAWTPLHLAAMAGSQFDHFLTSSGQTGGGAGANRGGGEQAREGLGWTHAAALR